MTRALLAGVPYFALTFGAGFVLGVIRTLWVTPRVGTRAAELMETPIMLLVIIAGASCLTRRLAVPPIWSARLSMGVVALVFLVAAEFALVVWMRGMSIREYFASRDAVAATVYYIMLVVFAVMPLLVTRS
jgi:hypothetical protein